MVSAILNIGTKLGKHGSNYEVYTHPKAKVSREETKALKKMFRVVTSCHSLEDLRDIPNEVRKNFHVDVIE